MTNYEIREEPQENHIQEYNQGAKKWPVFPLNKTLAGSYPYQFFWETCFHVVNKIKESMKAEDPFLSEKRAESHA